METESFFRLHIWRLIKRSNEKHLFKCNLKENITWKHNFALMGSGISIRLRYITWLARLVAEKMKKEEFKAAGQVFGLQTSNVVI